ncbi:hypothetical protein ZIOFF_001883 [Zingiber officinale]|uniref:Uncharacterized protein n=1 Tax=Zingiber officinale TaxID=94328 RepID=A0A8J5I696_ZINOF|nr:hypothetical protein ZIOFF_001883 [Zingiber officinale]
MPHHCWSRQAAAAEPPCPHASTSVAEPQPLIPPMLDAPHAILPDIATFSSPCTVGYRSLTPDVAVYLQIADSSLHRSSPDLPSSFGQHCSPAIHSVGHLVTTVSFSDISYQQLT